MFVAWAATLAAALASACGDDSSGGKSETDAGTDGGGDAGAGGEAGAGGASPYLACSEDDWCWDVPQPQGNALRGVWAGSASDIWAVGEHGTAIHWDGKGWASADTGTELTLHGVWGSGPSDVWAVGADATALRFDGKKWTPFPVIEPPDAEAGQPTVDFFAVDGDSKSNVWITGESGTTHHFDGTKWTFGTSNLTSVLRTVSVNSAGTMAAGDMGWLAVWNGIDWTPAGPHGFDIFALRATPGGFGLAVGSSGLVTKGTIGGVWPGPEAVPTTKTLRGLVFTSETEALVFGDDGETLKFSTDGTTVTWTKLSGGTAADFLAATPLPNGGALAVGQAGVMVKWQGGARTVLSTGGPANRLALASVGDDDLWAVGDEVMHYGGSTWQVVDTGSDRALYAAHAAAKDDVWAVGTGGTILHYTDPQKGWEPVEAATKEWLRGIWVTGSSGFVVGSKGTILGLMNGVSWVVTPSGTAAELNDVWMASATDAWAVGDLGTLLHWEGASWTPFPLAGDGGTSSSLRSVWGASAEDVWAVGTNGTIAHYDGKAWTVQATGEQHSLNDVFGSSPSDVWAVGSSGKILHYDGSTWTEQASGTSTTLNAVWTNGTGRVWVSGENGALLGKTL